MELKLHANARTTPKIREYIQKSQFSVKELTEKLGLSESTVRKWKTRTTVNDYSHTRHNLNPSTSIYEEELIVELRTRLRLSLSDITEVINRCINPKLTRSSIRRCLVRRNSLKLEILEEVGEKKSFDKTDFGYVHIDLKHLPNLEKKPSYVFVAIERSTRFVYVEIIEQRDGKTVAKCLERFCESFPHKIHTILTDNGSEFTDRFAMKKKNKIIDQPTGTHSFDLVCRKRGIKHKLTRAFTPQTNGMVERFNRRISEAMAKKGSVNMNQGKNKFINHAERNKYIQDFVYSYNRTRLNCLDYKSPCEVLMSLIQHNHTELYTFAGMTYEARDDMCHLQDDNEARDDIR